MLTGKPAFPGTDKFAVWNKISRGTINWPKEPIDPACKSLIEELLKPKPSHRLGAVPA